MGERFISYFSPEMVDEVVEKCHALIAANPNDPRNYRNLGHAQFKKGNYPEALAAFEKAVDLTPRETPLHLAIGRCCDLLKDFPRAEKAFNTALEQKPEWPDTHFWVGKVLFETGRLDEAKKYFQEAIERNPKFRDALYSLALVSEKQGHLQETIVNLKKVIALPTNQMRTNTPFPYDLDTLFDDPTLLEETIRQMETFFKTHDGYPDIHFKLGMAYRRKGIKEKAMSEFKKAIELNPNFHLARHYYWHWETEGSKEKE